MSVSAPAIKMSPPSNGDAMEISTPPGHSNPNSNANSASSYTGDQMANGKMSAEQSKSSSPQEQGSLASNQMPAPPPAAAAAVHQPKIVQTAFIHKLYKYGPLSAIIPPPNVSTGSRVPILANSTLSQHARGSQHPTPHFLVIKRREFHNVAVC